MKRRFCAPRALLLLLAVTALLLTSCQSIPNTGPDGDAFYTAPSPLPGVFNGDVIWYHYSNIAWRTDADAYQILYRSTSALGAPIAVSGSVIVPTAKWTGTGPRPIVAVAPGTQGMGDTCAPSKNLASTGAGDASIFLDKGYAVAMTDYEGLGTPGDHTYVVGPSLGHAVLDGARAATRMPASVGLAAGAPIIIAGYSEGGAGASWGGELAPTYAPELNLKGVVAGGVPADLVAVANNLEGGFGFGFLMAAAVGFNQAYPELNLASYLNATGQTEFANSRSKCTIDMVLSYANHHIADYTTSNPLNTVAWQTRLAQSKLGNGTQPVPALLYRGTTDQFMPLPQAVAQKSSYCSKGVRVQWNEYSGQDHLGTPGAATADIQTWVANRLAGQAAPTNC